MTARNALALLSIFMAHSLALPAAIAQEPMVRPSESVASADEILIVAKRSGMPIWRVSDGGSTLIVAGTIQGLSKDTVWDRKSLERAMLDADRIVYPALSETRVGLGFMLKFRRIRTMPKDVGLHQFLDPENYDRLYRLYQDGVIDADFDRKHPFYLANLMREKTRGDIKYPEDMASFLSSIAKQRGIDDLGVESVSRKLVEDELLVAPPQRHVPCLEAALAFQAAGPQALLERSRAWSEHRIQDVLNSPAQDQFEQYWPGATPFTRDRNHKLHSRILQLLAQPEVTIAVVDLPLLARPGALLDQLEKAGYDVSGPDWRK